jgi:hypothetical protein
MSRRSLGIGMKAPVSKVDCSKGGEVESSLGRKRAKGGIPPGVFARVGMSICLLELRDSRFGKC